MQTWSCGHVNHLFPLIIRKKFKNEMWKAANKEQSALCYSLSPQSAAAELTDQHLHRTPLGDWRLTGNTRNLWESLVWMNQKGSSSWALVTGKVNASRIIWTLIFFLDNYTPPSPKQEWNDDTAGATRCLCMKMAVVSVLPSWFTVHVLLSLTPIKQTSSLRNVSKCHEEWR